MKTKVEIRGEDFWIDGRPTNTGRVWEGRRVEGLLLNAPRPHSGRDCGVLC